jgi:hypothetical protein
MEKCPRCNGSEIAAGEAFPSEGHMRAFYPSGMKWWKLLSSVSAKFKDAHYACLKCGLVWNEIDPAELVEVLNKGAKDETKKKLGLL